MAGTVTPGNQQADPKPFGPRHFLMRLWERLNAHDSGGLAAEMTYHWVLSLVPMIIFLLTLIGLFGTQSDFLPEVMSQMHRMIPADAFHLIESSLKELRKDSTGSLAIVSLLGAMWTASNGAMTMEKALNRAYELETVSHRNFWWQRIIALFIVLGAAFIILICSNLVVFGEELATTITHLVQAPEWWLGLLAALRWLVSLGGLIVMGGFVYSIAPETREHGFNAYVWPGAVSFVTLWIAISILFTQYVVNFGNYNKVYGPMGALVVLMLWLYMTSYALLVGGEVNAVLLERAPYKSKRQDKASTSPTTASPQPG